MRRSPNPPWVYNELVSILPFGATSVHMTYKRKQLMMERHLTIQLHQDATGFDFPVPQLSFLVRSNYQRPEIIMGL